MAPPTAHSEHASDPIASVDLPSKLEDVSISVSEVSTPSTLTEKLQLLKPLLSEKALIKFPTDTEFQELAARWSEYKAPTPGAVVSVGCEEDIVATVCPLLPFPLQCPSPISTSFPVI